MSVILIRKRLFPALDDPPPVITPVQVHTIYNITISQTVPRAIFNTSQ